MKENDRLALVRLNFHHLQYFWAVARDGNLTRAARALRIAPSALSSQIRALEEQLGRPLFARVGRRLELTEAGAIAQSYAQRIFTTGNELVSTLSTGRSEEDLLRVGAVATLSRNFQRYFVRPLLSSSRVRLRFTAAGPEELLGQLAAHDLDVVLSNRPAPHDDRGLLSRRLARQSASIVSSERVRGFEFPKGLAGRAMILPGASSELRLEFDALCERLALDVRVLAEVDDMATIRLLAQDCGALALVPSVVVRDELKGGIVHELCKVPGLFESFYAITSDRRYQHPLVRSLLERSDGELLGDDRRAAKSKKPKGAPRSKR